MAETYTALVLRRVEYGDSDLILTLYCRELGKISALARSARSSRRRFGASLNLFTNAAFDLSRRGRSEMYTIKSGATLESFAELATDVAAFAHASYVTELARELTVLEHPDEALFDLLVDTYRSLRDRGALPGVLRVFELAVLQTIGLAPVVRACVICGKSESSCFADGAVFDANRGGAVCVNCAAGCTGLGVRPLSARAREQLIAAQTLAVPSRVERGQLEDPEARDCSMAVILGHVGKPLKSLEFIRQLQGRPRASS